MRAAPARGIQKNKMTYQMMESTLMERIADLRNSEADFARSLNSVRNGETNVDLNAQYLRMNAQLSEVEKLLARTAEVRT